MPPRRLGYKYEQLRPFNVRVNEPQPLVQSVMSGGMITAIDPADIPNENVQSAKNLNIREDKLVRRVGTKQLIAIPVGEVLKYAAVKDKTGALNKIAWIGTEVHDVTVVDTPIVVTPSLTHTAKDRIRTAYILDKLVFTNNGADPIQLVDFGTSTAAPLGNAPEYRYITGMFNRVVGAARKGVNEVEVGWSAEYPDIHEFNPAVIETAGSTPVIDTPDDLSDHITGIFSLSNTGLLLRENSIWGIAKQPIPQNPFHFYSAFSGLGSDTPNSAIRIRNGIAFADRKSECVWAYYPNQAPIPIGQLVKKDIFGLITDPETVFSGFSFVDDEYYLAIPIQNSDTVMVWVYNFKYKQWTYHTRKYLSSIDVVDTTIGGMTIDQLGEVPIDELVGTIDSLSTTPVSSTKKIFGETTGSIAYEDQDAVLDDNEDGAYQYESIAVAKVFNIPTKFSTVYAIRVEFKMFIAGTLELEYSKDNINWVTLKSITPTKFNVALEFIYRRPIRARRLTFRVKGSTGQWELLGYSIEVEPTGKSKEEE